MQSKRFAMRGEINREDCGAGGAVSVSRSRALGKALLPWAVAAATLLGGGLTAQAQSVKPADKCTINGTEVTCTRDLSPGVEVNSPDGTHTTLKVNTLTGDVSTGGEDGTHGINFDTHDEDTGIYGNTDITLTVDTGDHQITTEGITKGTHTRGISARSAGDVTVDVTGKITAKGICGTRDNEFGLFDCSEAIYARSHDDGAVTVNMTGDIETEGDPNELIDEGLGTTTSAGIRAISDGDGAVTVTLTGNIKATQRSRGIHAESYGAVTVEMKKGSTITTDGRTGVGILAESFGTGAVTVTVEGDITTKGEESNGISASSDGDVTVTVTGDITTGDNQSGGIDADSGGVLTVTMTGDITTDGGSSDGISAISDGDGAVMVTVDGNINTSDSTGIYAQSSYGTGDVTVDLEGAITTKGDRNNGISALIENEDEVSPGNIDITVVTGAITTSGENSAGIFAQSDGDGAVTVDVAGDITTTGGCKRGNCSDGIFVEANGAITVTVTGDINTTLTVPDDDNLALDNSQGIHAESFDKSVSVTVTGDITTEDGEGIYASAADGISITLHGGTITSAKEGIEFNSGTDNTLTIRGPVTVRGGEIIQVDGVDQKIDVRGGNGNETINNWGTLTTPGRIDLVLSGNPREETNALNNMAGATFYSGTSVVLGNDADDLFTNKGALSPGGAGVVQTTTLTGDFVNKAGSTFTVTIDPTTESSDQLNGSGTATLEGGTVKVTGVTHAYDGRYTILEAGDVDGEFHDVTDTLFIDHMLNYGDDYVTLSSRSKGNSFRDFAGTANQRTVAHSLDSLPLDNEIARAILALTEPAQARGAYTALSGEVHASLKGALMDTGQRTVAAIHSRMNARLGHPDAQTSTAASGNPWSLANGRSGLWVTGYSSWGETDATSNTAQMDTDLHGILFGLDRALGEHWRFGVLGGHSQTDVTLRARSSSGSVDAWSVGLYGGAEAGASSLHLGAIYNDHSIDTSRSVHFNGFSQRLSASYDAQSWQLFAEAGHTLQFRNLMLEPFAGVSFISLDMDRFSETGGTAALTSPSDTDNKTFTTLGMRSAMELKDKVHARGMVGWRHAFGDTDPSSTFTMSGSSPFKVTGAPIAQDALVTALGVEAELLDNVFLTTAYKGRYGDGAATHGFNAGITVKF